MPEDYWGLPIQIPAMKADPKKVSFLGTAFTLQPERGSFELWLPATTVVELRDPELAHLAERGRLARSARCPAPSWQGEPFNVSRQVITHARRSSRFGRPRPPRGSESGCAGRLLRPMSLWVSGFPTDEFMGVWIPDR